LLEIHSSKKSFAKVDQEVPYKDLAEFSKLNLIDLISGEEEETFQI
jgi:hypothetical protein